MRNERKYKIIRLLTMLLSVLLLGNCAREYWRLEAATERQHGEYVLKGAKVYAQNCMQCHGPKGEGVIGMPLNVPSLRGDASGAGGKDIYSKIYETLLRGRKGNDSHFQWEKTSDGHWISYSTMPAWGKDYGGPLDEDYLKALTLFIMNEDGHQWDYVGDSELAPVPAPDLNPPTKVDAAGKPITDPVTGEVVRESIDKLELPTSQVDSAANAAAQALLRNLGKSQCLTCHTIGSKGGKVGPDLSHVGSWGVDQAFLEEWIKYANVPGPNDSDKTPVVSHEKRMPVYWSANRAATKPEIDLSTKVVSGGPYNMPRFKGKLTDEEISTLAKYLMGLK